MLNNNSRANWLVVPLLAVAFTALPWGAIKIVDLMDGGDAIGADIGGGLMALVSPMAMAFLLGIFLPLRWQIWAASSALSLVLTALMYLLIFKHSWVEVQELLPFDIFMAMFFTVAGVLGSMVGESRRRSRGERASRHGGL